MGEEPVQYKKKKKKKQLVKIKRNFLQNELLSKTYISNASRKWGGFLMCIASDIQHHRKHLIKPAFKPDELAAPGKMNKKRALKGLTHFLYILLKFCISAVGGDIQHSLNLLKQAAM